MDISKLAKLLGYTTSPHDNEALNAIRMANSELDKSNLTWMDFCMQKTIIVQNIVEQQGHASKGTDATVEKMLQAILQHLAPRGQDYSGMIFIQSLANQYRKRGSLSEKQKLALEKWYNNV